MAAIPPRDRTASTVASSSRLTQSPLGRLDQKRALTNGKPWHCADPCDIWINILNPVVIGFPHFRQSCPALTFMPNVLSFVLADEAMPGRRVCFCVLNSACRANIVFHFLSSMKETLQNISVLAVIELYAETLRRDD
jgi:hypothetical protein